MDSKDAATVLLKRGKHVEEYPEAQAKRMLQLQKEMGTTDFEVVPAEPAEASATEPQTDSKDAPNGLPGNSVNPETDKRASTKKGG